MKSSSSTLYHYDIRHGVTLCVFFANCWAMNVHLKTLGCRLNEAELERWSQQFQAAGHGVVTEATEADLTVVNSCAVTGEAARKSRQTIRQLQRQNPAAKLVVSGCYASLQPDEAAGLLGVDLVISNADKDRLVDIVSDALDLPSASVAASEAGANALFSRGRSRAFVKVQDGCRYRCTFCIVTVARGEERSRSLAEVVAEINHLHQQGIQEAVLTGVHLGGYGSEFDSNLGELIKTVLAETDIPRLRLGSVEPWDLPADFFSLFNNPRLLPHLHLPLQSGSDQILRRMARRCKTSDFSRLAEQARQQVPDLNITTDVIVGFPGEDEAAWQKTLDYVESVGFGHLHIFPYSPRAETRAASLPAQVDGPTKKRRVRELHELGQKLKRATFERYKGRSFPILWEAKEDRQNQGWTWGYTPNFLRVALAQTETESLTHQIVNARLREVDAAGECVLAELIE